MISSSTTQTPDTERLMRGGANSGLGSPTVRSAHGPLMHPILRLSIPCGRAGHQSAEWASAPRPRRHAPGHPPYDGERYHAGECINTGFCGIPGQSGDKQALLHTPADAVNPTRGASPRTEPHARVNCDWETTFRERYPGFHAFPSKWRRTPRIKRSPVQTESGDAPPTGGDEHRSGLGASPETCMVWA